MTHLFPIRKVILTAAAIGLGGFLAAQVEIKRVPIESTPAVSGADMYYSYCASCHGPDGKGNGPAAAAMVAPLPDLTKLAKNHGGEFPTLSVMNTLGRIQGSNGHGSADMPVWGDVFRKSAWGEPQTQLRIYNLTQYLDSMQDPPSVKPVSVRKTKPIRRVTDIQASSGSAMYSGLCASCHGETGLGDGPAAASLKSRPTDLTSLAKKHNGEFPAVHIQHLLDRDPGPFAHGSKEMPIWGDTFRATGESPSFVVLRIHNIVSYLRSLQR